jgi:hypothetical protein
MGDLRSRATHGVLVGALALAALGGLVSCGGEATDSSVANAAIAADDTPGPLAFSATAVGGGTIDFAALEGQPTALWFWAPY